MIEDLARLVALPSVHDGAHAEACSAAADLVVELFAGAGVDDVRRVPTDDGSDAVVGFTRGPEGAPTVLLYSHYDVQPADPAAWASSPWELTERDGRLYGRGAADCKGNLVMLLTALRALPRPWPVGVRVVCEGSEEVSTGGLSRLVAASPEIVAADVMIVADAGNVELGTPTVTTSLRGTGSVLVTVRTMAGPGHSGMYGGAAPDALAALIAVLATLRDDAGDTTVNGLDNTGTWGGAAYPADRFAADAQVLPGVALLGSGSVADTVWARPAATVLAIDAPSVAGVTAAIQHEARAVVNLRVPPGQDAAAAQRLLVAHLEAAAPWGARVTVEPKTLGQPFASGTQGRGYAALETGMRAAYGRDLVEAGQGGAIPLCNTLQAAHPDAEILLIGVEEPACHIHAADESVDPGELGRTAHGVALMLAELGS
ncbi:MAG TPA: M20/M25/M40 family metallo-hydrolase [Nocardioides sp.]|nr:M20/M25/M40 family metallo-hydrolase [Nocardioides sp.]